MQTISVLLDKLIDREQEKLADISHIVHSIADIDDDMYSIFCRIIASNENIIYCTCNIHT